MTRVIVYCTFVVNFSSHNWNALFLGANAVADAMAAKYNTDKSAILDAVSTLKFCAVHLETSKGLSLFCTNNILKIYPTSPLTNAFDTLFICLETSRETLFIGV